MNPSRLGQSPTAACWKAAYVERLPEQHPDSDERVIWATGVRWPELVTPAQPSTEHARDTVRE